MKATAVVAILIAVAVFGMIIPVSARVEGNPLDKKLVFRSFRLMAGSRLPNGKYHQLPEGSTDRTFAAKVGMIISILPLEEIDVLSLRGCLFLDHVVNRPRMMVTCGDCHLQKTAEWGVYRLMSPGDIGFQAWDHTGRSATCFVHIE